VIAHFLIIPLSRNIPSFASMLSIFEEGGGKLKHVTLSKHFEMLSKVSFIAERFALFFYKFSS